MTPTGEVGCGCCRQDLRFAQSAPSFQLEQVLASPYHGGRLTSNSDGFEGVCLLTSYCCVTGAGDHGLLVERGEMEVGGCATRRNHCQGKTPGGVGQLVIVSALCSTNPNPNLYPLMTVRSCLDVALSPLRRAKNDSQELDFQYILRRGTIVSFIALSLCEYSVRSHCATTEILQKQQWRDQSLEQ